MELERAVAGIRSALRMSPAAEAEAVAAESRRAASRRAEVAASGVNPGIIDAAVASASLAVSSTGDDLAASTAVVQATFRETYRRAFRGLNTTSLAKGAGIVVVVYFIERFAQHVIRTLLLRGGLGTTAAGRLTMLVMTVIMGPLIEEYGRRLSHRLGARGGFSVALNTFEFISATRTMVGRGVPVAAAITARLITIFAMHKIAETIHQYFESRAELEGRAGLERTGFWLAAGFHSVWNLVASMLTDLDSLVEQQESDVSTELLLGL